MLFKQALRRGSQLRRLPPQIPSAPAFRATSSTAYPHKTLYSCSQAFASVRKRSQTFASVRKRAQAFANARKRSQAFASVAECRASLAVENCGETQKCRHFFDFASQQCQHSQGSEGSWSRNAKLSSLLDLRFVVASEKCQHSHGSGKSLSRIAKLSSLLDLRFVVASEKCQHAQGSGGPDREMQNCRHFWTCVSSSRLKSVNIHTDRGSPCRASQNCRHFWTCVSSSHLKSVNMHKDPGVLVAKRRTVVTFGLAFGRCVSKASTLTRIGGVLVAKCRTVVTLVHVFCPPLSLLKVLLPSLARHLSTALLPPAFPSWSSLASIVATLSLDILIKFPADRHLKFPGPPPGTLPVQH